MKLTTNNRENIKFFLKNLYIPPANSHKGQNGKVLIVGGSKLFHSASLWAAETASHFVDMVHYSSTAENSQIFLALKTMFRNGIVVPQNQIPNYVREDDAILIGPGMVRKETHSLKLVTRNFSEILTLNDEAEFTRELTHYLLYNFPEKRFVLDAGALQMMDPEFLKNRKTPVIITPHQGEFERMFKTSITKLPVEEKQNKVKKFAKEYSCVILMKAVVDIISDGEKIYVIEGGNQGLTKGGTGDILAGLTTAFYAKNDPLTSCILASFVEKLASEALEKKMGYWYNNHDLIAQIPASIKNLTDKI
ncbi:NAD(P)H-hydrate dehydratase [Candidatus Roizmanbacteria bacterium RIFCSPHIGHO2_12_FULL_38_13]|nr:MAG: NAD(P)H-hydrate dehydratase [Candidatus Roizmanbacteria bacterium RIFCSPHIGHO2_12_FULL_38_13]